MSGGYPTQNAGAAALDADAVCEVCGTVNPEGTLICRTCGNNLRDQKSRRLSSEMQLMEPERIRGSQLARGGLIVLGMLITVWVALNVNSIEQLLTGASVTSNPLEALYSGAQSAPFDAMLSEAEALQPTLDQVEVLRSSPVQGQGVDGNYALVQNDYYAGWQVVGSAIIRTDDTGIRFVASLGPGLQVRGMARSHGANALRSDWTQAAARDAEGRIYAVTGVAVAQVDGTVECFGQVAADESTQASGYEAIAYRLP